MASAGSSSSSAARSTEPLLLATRSADKAREIREILRVVGLEVRTLDELGVAPDPEEEAIESEATFRGNALAKARYFHARTGLATVADDSGIAVDALGGAPGVFSRRFSGADLTGIQLDLANNRTLLDALRDVPEENRGAQYLCAAALIASGRAPLVAIGSTRGLILGDPRGRGGFGYDPLFFIPALGRTFAEVDSVTKHRLSHRGRAFRALAAALVEG